MNRALLLLLSLILVAPAVGCDSDAGSPITQSPSVTQSAVPPEIKVGSELIIGMNNTPYQDPALWKQILVKEINGKWIKVEFVPRANSTGVDSTVTGWVNFDAVNWYSVVN